MKLFGWDGPYAGTKHAFMMKGGHRIPMPNPHQSDLDWSLVKVILAEADIDPREWDRLGR